MVQDGEFPFRLTVLALDLAVMHVLSKLHLWQVLSHCIQEAVCIYINIEVLNTVKYLGYLGTETCLYTCTT